MPTPLPQPSLIAAEDLIEGTILTALPYNPIPNIFVPHKYRNIIPPDPIYDQNDSFIVPGSREWFTYMYKLEKRLAIEAEDK